MIRLSRQETEASMPKGGRDGDGYFPASRSLRYVRDMERSNSSPEQMQEPTDATPSGEHPGLLDRACWRRVPCHVDSLWLGYTREKEGGPRLATQLT